MQVPTHLIHPVTIDNLDLNVNRAPDCALISDRAYRLGYEPIPLKAALKTLVDRFNVITNA